MSFEIKYDGDFSCLMCRMTGKIDLQLIEEFLVKLTPMMKNHKCSRILNDARSAELVLSSVDIYNIPKLFAQSGIDISVKRALVIADLKELHFFLETVSKNRSQNVKIFTDYDEALKWVTADSLVKSK